MNRAIERAHAEGILTAASLMVSGNAAANAVETARRLPTLKVGLHLVLADGAPTLPPERIPHLVDGRGRLRADLGTLGAAIFLRPRVRAEVAAEIEAQFEAFAKTGLLLDHVNGHHHFHVHPTIADLVLEVGRRYGLPGVRVPEEPRTLLDAIEPGARHRRDWAMAPWAARLRRLAQRRGLVVPRHVFGLAWTGALTESRLTGLLDRLPEGVSEIYCHPAASDDFFEASAGYRYRDELAALVAPEVRRLARRTDVRRGGFSDFRQP